MIPSPDRGHFLSLAVAECGPLCENRQQRRSLIPIVCIIEAMKLMNEIQAETAGEVVKIYVENGQPVEYGQPLFGIKR